MPTQIFRDEVQRLLRDEHAQLVDVLPAREFEDEHIPGAVNLPLSELDTRAPQLLDRSRPVVVY